jgi:hypothetical protein
MMNTTFSPGRYRGPDHAGCHRAGSRAVVMEPRLRLPPRPIANVQLRSLARGRHGRIREELAAGVEHRTSAIRASVTWMACSLEQPTPFYLLRCVAEMVHKVLPVLRNIARGGVVRQVRQVLRLKFVGGVPTREIARRIGVAPSSY